MSLKLSLPSKAQLIRTVELAVVAFGATFFGALTTAPSLDKATLIAAATAGIAAAYRVVKSLVTNL